MTHYVPSKLVYTKFRNLNNDDNYPEKPSDCRQISSTSFGIPILQ